MRLIFKALSASLAVAGLVVAGLAGGPALSPAALAAPAADGPAGFYYGTDSFPVAGTGSAPYQEPVTGGSYGGYMGMSGNWARTEGCKTGNFLAWAPANADQANVNYKNYHLGVGTGTYWYMGGPGVDPKMAGRSWSWTGSNLTAATTEAYQWGKQQAAWALAAIKGRYIPYPVMWADIELPGIAPAQDNGWNSVYTATCSGKVKQLHVPAVVDRSVLNGFASYLTSHSGFKLGVYSSPLIWPTIFGSGSYSKLPTTYEWTYSPGTGSLSQAPLGWFLRGTTTSAQFFGGQTDNSKYALMWQWSGGGGITNGHGDFDQIDTNRMK